LVASGEVVGATRPLSLSTVIFDQYRRTRRAAWSQWVISEGFMRLNRLVAGLTAALLALSVAPAAFAQPADTPDGQGFGRLPEQRGPAVGPPGRVQEAEPASRLSGQPRNDVIEDVPVNANDASIPLNLIPYHEFPGLLRGLQESDRISVEIIGESVQGRDLHLVVATSAMTDAEWDQWQELSDLRTEDPDAAITAMEAGAYDDWKSPLFVNNNIHGNEWEGTDATFEVLDELAFSDDEEIVQLVEDHVLAFVISQNPDGRVNATRANANGFDMNRDFITQSQPETRILRDQLIRYNALTMLDQHGYVNLTLIEPTTGPHGDNYEYDLYIKNALRNALAMEEAVLATGEPTRNTGVNNPLVNFERIRIPYRDNTTGWDDWPPIFTPMYAMYHGIVGHTVEFPHNPRGIANVAIRHERTRVNTAIARATIEGNFAWVNENKMDVLGDQLELYRRGVAGEPLRPIDDPLALELAAGDNANTVEIDLPRAYVIPTGDGQRSEAAAARTVQFLLDNDVIVQRATRQFTLDGTRYAAGSYVVDMHQAKRGMANTILEVGRDVSDDYPTMYDISAWSLGSLWGATVDRFEDASLSRLSTVRVTEAATTASVVPGKRQLHGLIVDSLAGVQAVNDLLDRGVKLSRLSDGEFVVSGAGHAAIVEVAREYGVTFSVMTPAKARGAEPFETYRIGASAFTDEVFSLNRMGFEVTNVTHTGFNNGSYAFDDFDAFYVGATNFNPDNLNATQEAAFDAWLADGGAVVGRGSNGNLFNTRANLLDVTLATARNDANGIVAVVNDPASVVTGNALPESFVTSPRYFPQVGEGVSVDQRLADEGFFLAGHWIGQGAAAGQPVVVSGEARGANVTLFGTEPLYRTHPEGLFDQVAQGLWKAG
jgi:hypothetical protein